MKNFRFTFNFLVALAFTLAFTSFAYAQQTRSWVSGVGDDINPCTRTAPCKTFATAQSKTAAGGEIDALDPGGFGTITFIKSMTIDGGGTLASILSSGGINGVIVNDSSTTPGQIVVVIRNISIQGVGTGLNGVNFFSGKALHVENCRLLGFTGSGITATFAGSAEIFVEDTTISGAAGSAVNINAGGTLVSINKSVLKDSGTGLSNNAGAVNISNSLVTGNSSNGMTATSGAAVINASGNTVTNNVTNGINAAVGSVVRVSNNDIYRNGTGLNNAGTMETFRNNKVRGNITAQVTGVLTDVSAVNNGIF